MVDLAMDWSVPDDFFGPPSHGAGSGGGGGEEFNLPNGYTEGGYTAVGGPKKKRAWDKSRQHGGNTHWGGMKSHYRRLVVDLRSKGVTVRYNTLRTNQALVDSGGSIIRDPKTGSYLRPDVQFVGSDGKVYIVEIGVSQ